MLLRSFCTEKGPRGVIAVIFAIKFTEKQYDERLNLFIMSYRKHISSKKLS